jgi:hypothetical protein
MTRGFSPRCAEPIRSCIQSVANGRQPNADARSGYWSCAGIAAGFEDNGAPGVREQYSSEEAGLYYAAFLLDPDGTNIEAVFPGDF